MIESGRADLLTLLAEQEVDEVPAGWMTGIGWAGEWGISDRYARELLRRALAKNLVEKKAFRIKSGNGVRLIPHYKQI